MLSSSPAFSYRLRPYSMVKTLVVSFVWSIVVSSFKMSPGHKICSGVVHENVFSHPDYTVGAGIPPFSMESPAQPPSGSWTIPSVGHPAKKTSIFIFEIRNEASSVVFDYIPCFSICKQKEIAEIASTCMIHHARKGIQINPSVLSLVSPQQLQILTN